MPARRIQADGREWLVYPSGYITAMVGDEFGLFFVAGTPASRDVRVTRYSSTDPQAREHSLASMSDQDLVALFRMSQPSTRSPEAGYRP